MSVYYYEIKKIIISLLIIIIDGILVYYSPAYFNNISYLYPMLTITFLPFICFNNKRCYIYTIFLGITYDLLYSNIYLYNVILFIFLTSIDQKVMKYFKNSLFSFIMMAVINIVIYDIISFLLVILTNYQVVGVSDLIYKISHSLIFNIMSVFVWWFIFKKNIKYA